MDNTEKPPAVLSLCSGYGGIERGLERVFGEIHVLAHVEIEAFAIANLVNKMETGEMVPAPIWTDLKTFRPGIFRGMVDILTGGYPCQPFSAAGNRRGDEDPRHLWPYVREVIRQCEPRRVFFENVEGHISLGLPEVLSDLEEMAYTVECGVFSAAEVGAPHQRKRVFILAYSERSTPQGCSDQLADARLLGQEKPEQQTTGVEQYRQKWPARPGEPQHEWEEPRTLADARGLVVRPRASRDLEHDAV